MLTNAKGAISVAVAIKLFKFVRKDFFAKKDKTDIENLL